MQQKICFFTASFGRGRVNTILKTYLTVHYNKHFDCGGYFHETDPVARESEIHLLFMVNTDGVFIFCSSNFGLWRVYFVINELPPEKRYC